MLTHLGAIFYKGELFRESLKFQKYSEMFKQIY